MGLLEISISSKTGCANFPIADVRRLRNIIFILCGFRTINKLLWRKASSLDVLMTKLFHHLFVVLHHLCTAIGAGVREDAPAYDIAAPGPKDEAYQDFLVKFRNSPISIQNRTDENRWDEVVDLENGPLLHYKKHRVNIKDRDPDNSDNVDNTINDRRTFSRQYLFRHKPASHGIVRRMYLSVESLDEAVVQFKSMKPVLDRQYEYLKKENNVKVSAQGVKFVVPDTKTHQEWIDRIIASPQHRLLHQGHQSMSKTREDYLAKCSFYRNEGRVDQADRIERAVRAWWSSYQPLYEEYALLCRRYDMVLSDAAAERRRNRTAGLHAGRDKQVGGDSGQGRDSDDRGTGSGKNTKGLTKGFLGGKVSKGLRKGFFDRGKGSQSGETDDNNRKRSTGSPSNNNEEGKAISKRSVPILSSHTLIKRVVISLRIIDDAIRQLNAMQEALDRRYAIVTEPSTIKITAHGVIVRAGGWEHGEELQATINGWLADDLRMRADQSDKIGMVHNIRDDVIDLRAEGKTEQADRLAHALNSYWASYRRFYREVNERIRRLYHMARTDAREIERRERIVRARARAKGGKEAQHPTGRGSQGGSAGRNTAPNSSLKVSSGVSSGAREDSETSQSSSTMGMMSSNEFEGLRAVLFRQGKDGKGRA